MVSEKRPLKVNVISLRLKAKVMQLDCSLVKVGRFYSGTIPIMSDHCVYSQYNAEVLQHK